MKLIRKILIANRGEIAARIIKTLDRLGIATVAIYTEDDKDALYCRKAKEKVLLSGQSLAETFLNMEKIIQVAKDQYCHAIHPGYGFLSESSEFAGKVREAGLIFIGPSAEAIAAMGDKANARDLARKLSIPLIQGIEGTIDTIMKGAAKLGFPLLVKAASGGGGKAIRIATDHVGLGVALEEAMREAENYFGDKRVYVEKYFEEARHIEVQVLADNHGNIVIPGERECTVQRRYQKIIEEAPSVFLKQGVREQMFSAVRKIVRKINYVNAGTLEFLVDQEQNFYFLEMNTRIQVEHPVTEMVSDIDIIELQLAIAEGREIPFKQEEIKIRGHAIEARIYAEDPLKGFVPSPGMITEYAEPEYREDIRIDSGIDGPFMLNSHYDPLIAKVISYDKNRKGAIEKLVTALKLFTINGIKTNREFLVRLLENHDYVTNVISITWLEKRRLDILHELNEKRNRVDESAILIAWALGTMKNRNDKLNSNPWRQIGFWRMLMKKSCIFQGRQYDLLFEFKAGGLIKMKVDKEWKEIRTVYRCKDLYQFYVNGKFTEAGVVIGRGVEDLVTMDGMAFHLKPLDRLPQLPFLEPKDTGMQVNGHYVVKSPMFGRIVKLNVETSGLVSKGDLLCILDSMKIENKILSPVNGCIKEISVMEGEQISLGHPIMLLENKPIN